MSWNKLFFQCLEFIAAGACSILFIFQLMDIWNHYVNKATYVAAENQPETPLALPIITICPVHAYKTNSFKSSLEGYLNNTYRLEEIFSNSTIQELNNETRFKVEAVHSRYAFLKGLMTICITILFISGFMEDVLPSRTNSWFKRANLS